MGWYKIVTGILLTLSIIDFALAAPVLVQEKRQARVGEAHIPKDIITGLGKRWDEELAKIEFGKMVEDYLRIDPTLSSSSAPLVHDHGSTNFQLLPTPDSGSSTANRHPLIVGFGPPLVHDHGSTNVRLLPTPNSESPPANLHPLIVGFGPPSGLSTVDMQHSGWGHFNAPWDDSLPVSTVDIQNSGWDRFNAPGDDALSVVDMQNSGWDRFNTPADNRLSQEGDGELRGPLYTPTSSESGYGSELELAEEHMYAPQPDHYSIASTDTSIGSDFDWDYYMNSKDTAPPSPASPEDQVHSPSLGVWSPTEPEHEAVPAPPPSHLPDPPSTSG